jgi:hypothetical protein
MNFSSKHPKCTGAVHENSNGTSLPYPSGACPKRIQHWLLTLRLLRLFFDGDRAEESDSYKTTPSVV